MFEFRLHPLYEMDGDIGAAPSVEGTTEEVVSEGTAPTQEAPAEETPTETESSFAKRLREHSEKAIKAEREKWEQEVREKYGDYDVHKELSAYLQELNGVDAMTLKEQIEMERLQQRAEQNAITPEMQRRLEVLEEKAAKADEIEKQQELHNWYTNFKSEIAAFASEKGANADEIEAYMIENGLQNYQVAYKALRAEQLEQELTQARETAEKAKEIAVKEYLESKKGPRVEGSGSPGVVHEDTSKLSWTDLRQRALDRIKSQQQSS
ncbi:MFS transporter [Cohnella ginsengisoli]|uniref:MFS transporter n=1 Tax=Cohnella ginsengisoli TaxID=425004 RepID=A0A9X4KH92_9BACL|nr:MFS transporter [Cohnella ginsengisoli]MDG0791921.1 MFS transporter [Cohnella ginsengisoli]